ncbi:hypothetical protein [Coralliovum pocilloporae]|uniref:hypothetical protein n=1 Tax=Coralliovum pocilloporae TaxID=3066369 RepID=UPI00330718A1
MKLLIPLIILVVTISLVVYRGLIRPSLSLADPYLSLADAAATVTIAIITWYAVQSVIFSVKRRFEQEQATENNEASDEDDPSAPS